MTMKQPPPHVKLRRRVWGDSAASTALAAAVADDEFTAAGVDELRLHSSAGRQMFPSWALSNRNNSRTPSPAPFPTTISNDYHGGNNGSSLVTVKPAAKPRQQQELYQSKRSTTSSSSYGSAATTTSSSTAAAPVASGGNALFPPSRGGFFSTFSHSHQIALHGSQLKRTHSPSTESVVANKKAAPPPKPKRYFMPLSLSETDLTRRRYKHERELTPSIPMPQMTQCGTATDSSASVADEAAQQQQQWNWKERGETTAFTAQQRRAHRNDGAVSELAQPPPLVDSGIEEFEDLSTNHNALFRGRRRSKSIGHHSATEADNVDDGGLGSEAIAALETAVQRDGLLRIGQRRQMGGAANGTVEKVDNFLVGNRNAALLGFAGGGSGAGAGADADDERSTTTTNSTDAMSCRSIYVKKPGQKQFTYASSEVSPISTTTTEQHRIPTPTSSMKSTGSQWISNKWKRLQTKFTLPSSSAQTKSESKWTAPLKAALSQRQKEVAKTATAATPASSVSGAVGANNVTEAESEQQPRKKGKISKMNALKLNFGVTSSSATAAAIQNKQSKQQQQRPFGSISNLTMLSNDPAVAAANAAQRTKLGVPLPLRKVSSPAYIDLGETAAVVTAPTTPCQTPTSTGIFGGNEKNAFARTRQKSPTSRLRRALGLGLNSASITDITKRLKGSNDRLGSLLRKHSSKRHKNDGAFAIDSAEITGRGEGCSAVFYDEMLGNSNGATAKQTTVQQQSKNVSQADYSANKFSTHSTTDSDRTMICASSSKNASSLASKCYESAQLTTTLKCQPKAQVKTSLPAVKMFSEKTALSIASKIKDRGRFFRRHNMNLNRSHSSPNQDAAQKVQLRRIVLKNSTRRPPYQRPTLPLPNGTVMSGGLIEPKLDQHEAAVVERLVDVGSLEGSSSPSSPLFPQRQRHYQQSNSGEKYHLPVPSLSKWSGAVDCHDDTSRSSGTDSFVTANEHFIFVSSDEMAHAGARRTGTDHCSLNSSSAGVGGGDSSGDVFYYSAVSSASASSQKPQQQQPLSSSLASANKTIIPLNDLPSPFITQQQRSTAPTTETFTRNNAIPPLHSFSGGKKFAAAPPAPTTTAATDAGDISVVCVDNDGTSTSTVWTDQIQMIANQLKQFSVDVEPHKLPQKHVF